MRTEVTQALAVASTIILFADASEDIRMSHVCSQRPVDYIYIYIYFLIVFDYSYLVFTRASVVSLFLAGIMMRQRPGVVREFASARHYQADGSDAGDLCKSAAVVLVWQLPLAAWALRPVCCLRFISQIVKLFDESFHKQRMPGQPGPWNNTSAGRRDRADEGCPARG